MNHFVFSTSNQGKYLKRSATPLRPPTATVFLYTLLMNLVYPTSEKEVKIEGNKKRCPGCILP